jgi:hypothetical protein
MPTNLTDNDATYPSPVASPANGDLANAASIQPGLQTLANRTAYLKRAIEYVGPVFSGVMKLRSVENFAALRGVTGMVNRDVVKVVGYGLYEYQGDINTAESIPNIVTPTGLSASFGRWVRLGHAASNLANGPAALNSAAKLATTYLETNVASGVGGLDASAKLPVANMRNAIIASASGAQSGGPYNIVGEQSIPSTAISFTCLVGDVIMLSGAATIELQPTFMPGAYVKLGASQAPFLSPETYAMSQPARTIQSVVYANATNSASVHWRHVVATAGTVTFTVRVEGDYAAGSVGFNVLDSHITGLQYRP